jgi:hypothetical protein
MKFIFFYSQLYNYFYNHITQTINGVFDVDAIQIDDLPTRNSGHTFFGGVSIKVELIIQKIKENMGSTILFTDATILLNKNKVNELNEFLTTYLAHDLCFADNDGNGYYNIGVILIHCNVKTLHFFENVLADLVNTGGWDQDIINKQLSQPHDLLVKCFNRTKIYCGYDFNRAYIDSFYIYKSFIHHTPNKICNYNQRLIMFKNYGLISDAEYNSNIM